MRRSPLGSLLLVLATCLPVCAQQDWPQWRGPNRDGHAPPVASPAFTNSTVFRIAWTANVGTGFSSIVVSQGKVITVGNREENDTISCLKEDDGSLVWKQAYPAPLDPNLFEGGPTATPTIAGDRVYAISRRGDVHCLNLADGAIFWKRRIVEDHSINVPSWGFAGSPLVLADRLILNAGSHGVCLATKTGETLWHSDNTEDAGYTSPVPVRLGDTDLVLLESGKSLTSVDPNTGDALWTSPWVTRYGINAADPLVLGEGRVLVSSGYGKGTALVRFSAAESEQVWRVREFKNQMSPGVLIDGTVFGFDGDSGSEVRLVALDPETGEVRWSEVGFGAGSLIAVGRQLLILSETGELVAADVDRTGMRVLSRQQILSGKCWTPVAYACGAVYARNAAGDVVKVGVR